ncbi:uncharacterized protein LOC126868640 isoform X1 [Bombus huntii]|uniref:uncharacterized protein LOC126868640 isoform X1 n=1 Tax=Bombus huntii TaxID=85661 RepID=UPI0021AA63F7|nr:uncharacterized protein LOC126868640 isoform X1 [Bombus huntii]XP_050480298.1 uncharacterized protein LOC126868640 isoform X1 [Bombus huntii]XP_050480299.1 uncharacterized protein LOC126868640 isoform X1 [Bombus huntii]XP_050480300.1 uncharacterized protein LOC126868640 isoform X1 [Bombus huntii]XP_050480301.1 uncharacterized protein LOC126868640 isoform X1 [Bombus huntii]
MKPQKKAAVARKATKMPTIAKKRRSFLEKSISDIRKEKKPKKLEKGEDAKRKIESDKKKSEKTEERKKIEDKKKIEEKRKEKSERVDEKKKCIKDYEKKWEKTEEKKSDKTDEKITDECTCDSAEKKKLQKMEEKPKVDKQLMENKKKPEKLEDKKKCGKFDDENVEEQAKLSNVTEENDLHEEKLDHLCTIVKKKCKDEKKKDSKLMKPDIKENMKISVIKDKKSDRKKLLEKGMINTKSPLGRTKKDSKAKSMQKKGISRKTVLAKKSHLSVVQNLVDKKIKLSKLVKDEETSVSEEDETMKRTKRKNVNISKNKIMQEKKPKLGKHMKAKLPSKSNKINTALKKDDKLKTLVEKVISKKRLDAKETEKLTNEHKKIITKDELNEEVNTTNIKSELEDDKDIDKSNKEEQSQSKSQDIKKIVKCAPKIGKKIMKKKVVKVQIENTSQTSSSSEETSSEESGKQIKVCEDSSNDNASSKQEQVDSENILDTNLKDEPINGDNISGNTLLSESEDESDDETKKNKQKEIKKKERSGSPSDERVRRMRLFGFWSGPKRYRVASLNALAKVHCLYENETGGVYLGGFCKPKPEKEKQKKNKEEKEEQIRKEKEKKVETKAEENIPKRKLRNVPGLRGKHWDMLESSSSSSSSDDECERDKNMEHNKKKIIKRRKKNEEVMDLKDMVVCKRMASLNATAILAASYSDEKNRCGSSSDSSSESEVEIIKKRKQNDSDIEKRKSRQNPEQDEVLKPSNKLVIVNQDTDVTITGVYVNQTRSTHHEGYCSIAGMQYRISSTSHTQTAATAVATELHDQQKLEQPCKSYTPLGALSSMQPPGSQSNHPNMSPRRHSAFSAPHQHGYYQPAGPLIQHPPTLPPIKGPPPEPTPTPPQNSEGSDDLVATSTTSGGTSSTGGGFYRAYCPQYYGTPPQYADLCYPPTYSHPHAHPPPYYKYAPTYRRYLFRQYYGYQESGGGGGPGSGGTAGGPAVVDYQPPPPPPGEYPLPPYYGGYPPPPPPPPPPPNPAYLHSQGRPFVDHAAFQGCPCPMQSCPKNVDTGPLIGNGKGAPVVSGPGLSLPPSALVGPPSPARGLAGLAPPHGANAWDTDRVQLNTHRNLNQNQPSVPPSHNLVGGHNRPQNSDCKNKDEKDCSEDKLQKCGCQKHACTSTCEVKLETLSPSEKLAVTICSSNKFHNFKLENNNVKCESCSVEMGDNVSCVANCNVKCESDYKCDIMKCEQCMKEGQMAILEIDKDSGILLDDKLDADPDVKEELSDVVTIDSESWKKPDYEPTVQETIEETIDKESTEKPEIEEEHPKCQKVSKRKLSLDSLSDSRKKRKVSKRTLSVGSSQDLNNSDFSTKISIPILPLIKKVDNNSDESVSKKKQPKKDNQNHKRKVEYPNCSENITKKSKTSKQSTSNNIPNYLKRAASDNSIMETINNVIQQSLQMTQKRDRKSKNVEKTEKKKEVNLLPAAKKVVKKVDLVKELTSEKLSKVITKSNQSKSRTETRTKSRTHEKNKYKGKGKSKVYEAKTKDNGKKPDSTTKSKTYDIQESCKKPALIKKKRKNTKKLSVKKSSSKIEDCLVGSESLLLTRKTFLKPKWSNGWSWEGDPFEAKVYLTNEESAIRRCYASMKHESGDVLRPRDCVLLKSGPRKADLPFVAKIAALWENPDDGEMMFSLLWYYRPEHTEQGRTQYDTEDEVFASRHRDANSVACIEDKCYILTFNEYCRYRKNLRRIEEGLESPGLIVPPGDQLYPRENRQPPIPVPSDMVLFCRRVYDYRGKKLVKNPG